MIKPQCGCLEIGLKLIIISLLMSASHACTSFKVFLPLTYTVLVYFLTQSLYVLNVYVNSHSSKNITHVPFQYLYSCLWYLWMLQYSMLLYYPRNACSTYVFFSCIYTHNVFFIYCTYCTLLLTQGSQMGPQMSPDILCSKSAAYGTLPCKVHVVRNDWTWCVLSD